MGSKRDDPAGHETEEEFPEEFQCCVCLDLLYKPVVLACGHISCFWCVFRTMDSWRESRCPVCRNPYYHFPSICKLLHLLLLKLYPLAYKRREQLVLEEEKRSEKFSPQLENFLSGPEPSEKLNICSGVPLHLCNNVGLGLCSMVEDDIKGASESAIKHQKDDKMSILAKSAFEATGNVVSEQNRKLGDKSNGQKNSELVLIADLLCGICKELLYRPIVLNCGHVFCEACIHRGDEVPRCHVCQCVHPNGYPKVCLVLKHFLEEQFPEQYALRKESLSNQGPIQAQRKVSQSLSKPSNSYLLWLSGKGPKVHPGVGCDYCGICPIIGERYRCKDCKEKMGFDLCEGCYNTSSKLPGRFNQQHTPEHRLEIVQPQLMSDLVLRLGDAESEEDEGPVDMEYIPHSPSLGRGPPLALDPEHAPAAPASENTSEDEGGTYSSSI